MSKPHSPHDFSHQLEDLFGGDLNSLEGELQAQAIWTHLIQDEQARSQYERCVQAFRMMANSSGVKSFHDAEADALWPIIMAHVTEDAKTRTGLSKAALKHLHVPELVSSITQALVSMKEQPILAEAKSQLFNKTTVELPLSVQQTADGVDFALTSISGEVSLRLYRKDGLDVRCNVADNELRSNIAAQDVEDWELVTRALSELSLTTTQLLGEEALIQGHIKVQNGLAHIHLVPLNVSQL